jgi:hypothetical protein
MSKHLIVILLFVSLAFNLAVLGMFIYSTAFHKMPLCHPSIENRYPGRDDRRETRLLPEAALKNKDEIRKLREEFFKTRREFMQILAKDKYNEQEAQAAMEQSLQAQDRLERKLGASLIEVRKNMDPAEAKKFFEHRMRRTDRRTGAFRPYMNIDDNPSETEDKGVTP